MASPSSFPSSSSTARWKYDVFVGTEQTLYRTKNTQG